MAKTLDRAAKIRELYLSLPDTEETPTWGSPHFRVAGKIFGGFGEEGGVTSIGLKLEMEHADAMVASDPRFTRARYVGHKGWVSIDVSNVDDWEELRQLVLESYRLIAPKRTLAKLSGGVAAAAKAQPKSSAKSSAAAKTKRSPNVGTTAKQPAAGKSRLAGKSSKAPEKSARKARPAAKRSKAPSMERGGKKPAASAAQGKATTQRRLLGDKR